MSSGLTIISQDLQSKILQLREELYPDIVHNAGQAGKLRQTLACNMSPPRSANTRPLSVVALSFGLPKDAVVGAADFQSRAVWAATGELRKQTDVLEHLARVLSLGAGRGRLAALCGASGCGKSAVAAAALFRARLHEQLSPMLWLDASCPAALCRGFVALAKKIMASGFGSGRKGEARIGAVELVKAWMRVRDDWLLVLDNVQEGAGLRSLRLPLRNGRVLVTTQLGQEQLRLEVDCERLECEVLEIGPYEDAEALRYLTRAAGCSESDGAALAGKLQRFPLGLSLAVAYLRGRKGGVARLSAELDACRARRSRYFVTADSEFRVPPPDLFYEMVSVQLAALRSHHPGACDMALMLAFLHPDGIRVCEPEHGRVGLQVTGPDLATLVRHGLLTEGDAGAVAMHEMVQEVLRNSLRQTAGPGAGGILGRWRVPFLSGPRGPHSQALKDSDERAVSPYHEYRGLAEGLVKAEMRPVQGRGWKALPQVAPHLLRLIEWGCHDLDILSAAAAFLSDVQDEPRRSLELRSRILREHLRQLREAGPESEGTAGAGARREAVVETYLGMGGVFEGREKLDSAIQVHRRSLPPSLPLSPLSLSSCPACAPQPSSRSHPKRPLSAVVSSEREYAHIHAQAHLSQTRGPTTQVYESALKTIADRMGGQPAAGAARVLERLGATLLRAGRCKSARLRLEEALALQEGVGVEGAGQARGILACMGRACYLEGDREAALASWRRALELEPDGPGGDAIGTGELLNCVGLALLDLRRVEEAEASYREAIRLADAACSETAEAGSPGGGGAGPAGAGAKGRCLADGHAGLGMVYQRMGRWEDALRHYKEALLRQARTGRGRGELGVVKILDSMACVYGELGMHEEAASLLGESLSAKERLFPGEPTYLAECRLDLVAQLRRAGRGADALEACAAAYAALVISLPPADPRVLAAAALRAELAAATVNVTTTAKAAAAARPAGAGARARRLIASPPRRPLVI